MFFVTDRPKLMRAISIVRSDRTNDTQFDRGPYLRLEAEGDWLTILADEVGASVPATVYEPGVLFLQITYFRKLLRSFAGQKSITVQVTATDLHIGNVKMPLYRFDMLLYPDTVTAPRHHPCDRMRQIELPAENEETSGLRGYEQLLLFDDLY